MYLYESVLGFIRFPFLCAYSVSGIKLLFNQTNKWIKKCAHHVDDFVVMHFVWIKESRLNLTSNDKWKYKTEMRKKL